MITIKGSYVGNRRDSAEAIEFFRRGVSVPRAKIPFVEMCRGLSLL
jgi:hypothetical protein